MTHYKFWPIDQSYWNAFKKFLTIDPPLQIKVDFWTDSLGHQIILVYNQWDEGELQNEQITSYELYIDTSS